MHFTIPSIALCMQLFLSLSTAFPTLDNRTCDCTNKLVNRSSDPSLQAPPAVPHTIQNGLHFLRAVNYTSPAMSSYSLIPCLLTLGQTVVAHVAAGGGLNDTIPVPHGFQCTKDGVNLLLGENPQMKYNDLNEVTYLLQNWQQSYTVLGMDFEYGVDSQVISHGSWSTKKVSYP